MVLLDAPGAVRLRQDPDPDVVTEAIEELHPEPAG
jgi:hypothetical protein